MIVLNVKLMNWSITYIELMPYFFYFDEINILVIGIRFSSLICYQLLSKLHVLNLIILHFLFNT